MGVAVGMLVAGLILGYMIGARKELLKMLRKLAAAASAPEADKDAGKDGDDGENEEADDDDALAVPEDLLVGFLDSEWLGGHDDHPDTELNPILIYQVKRAKDELRQRKQFEALLAARDLPPDHLETLDPAARKAFIEELKADTSVKVSSNVGSVSGLVRKYGASVNSTAIMVKSGARFMPRRKGGGLSAEAAEGEEKKKSQEVRDRLRTIDTHLAAMADIDISKNVNDRGTGTQLRAGSLGLSKNAFEKAKETRYKPYGGDRAKLLDELHTYAMRGRARVSAPLDHAISAQNERTRRASCGAAGKRRASVSGGANSGGSPQKSANDDDDLADKMMKASGDLEA